MIKKTKKGFIVKGRTGFVSKPYKTKSAAVKRSKQIYYFAYVKPKGRKK